MKSLGGIFCVVVMGFGLLVLSSSAQAYRYGKGSAAANSSFGVAHRHKVKIRYRRRVGRRYGRRIASFVRFGPYAARRSIRRTRKARRGRKRW